MSWDAMLEDEASRTCSATLTLDFDSLWCRLREGHTGPHWDRGEQGGFSWQPADQAPNHTMGGRKMSKPETTRSIEAELQVAA